MEVRIKGRVKWFNNKKGHGFITTEEGKDYFVHYSDIDDRGFKSLKKNEEVSFISEQTIKGLKAKNVRREKKNVKIDNSDSR